ncbi:unnamed protein product [Staurois parvus]|uniref:Uncharacterized protein n=1 Tax=Staurois parvus TaxID=386267 RepID=A0ABN9B2R5_9NEOB|nr:unnamed protein product [Staurois parvus]
MSLISLPGLQQLSGWWMENPGQLGSTHHQSANRVTTHTWEAVSSP